MNVKIGKIVTKEIYMKYVKSTLAIVILFFAYTAFAARSGAAAQTAAKPTAQAKPAAKGRAQARGKGIVKQPVAQQSVVQQKKGPQKEYGQILSQLQKIQPTTDDFLTLVDIQTEVNEQIVKAKFPKKPNPQPTNLTQNYLQYAQELFNKYPINLNKTQEQCTIASENDENIFTDAERAQQIIALNNIVTELVDRYPDITETAINKAIIDGHPGFLQLKKKLTADQYADITQFLKKMIHDAWVSTIAP